MCLALNSGKKNYNISKVFSKIFNDGFDSSLSTLTLAITPLPLPVFLELSLGLCFVHAPRLRLLHISLSKRKQRRSRGTGFSRTVHHAVFSARVIALDIHWTALLWKTVTKRVEIQAACFSFECWQLFFYFGCTVSLSYCGGDGGPEGHTLWTNKIYFHENVI